MQSLVYFPTFEPPSETWLKFALLYMDDFSPIIPDRGFNQLSDSYKQIIGETDLINPYAPIYEQGERAGLKAIELVESLISRPYRKSELFREVNLIRAFSNRSDQQFKIYKEKFTYRWEDFCLANGFALKTDGGILTTEKLAFIYMTCLADEIAYEEGKSIITDDSRFDSFLNYQRLRSAMVYQRQNVAQGIVSLTVPRNLSEISFSRLIEFRNSRRDLIKAFNIELDSSINGIQSGDTALRFVERYNNIYSELTREVIAQGAGLASIPLAMYLVLSNQAARPQELLKEIATGLGMFLTARIAIGGRWKDILNRHNCRRYLTHLGRL